MFRLLARDNVPHRPVSFKHRQFSVPSQEIPVACPTRTEHHGGAAHAAVPESRADDSRHCTNPEHCRAPAHRSQPLEAYVARAL
jgi:hypothetical protein